MLKAYAATQSGAGSTWANSPVPALARRPNTVLIGVFCARPSKCVAVGGDVDKQIKSEIPLVDMERFQMGSALGACSRGQGRYRAA